MLKPPLSIPPCGRFAPTPSGALHFGSLIAALGSFLQARHQHGRWLVRIEDVDETRSVSGAADSILDTLDALHLHWDGEIIYQSQRTALYKEYAAHLKSVQRTYPCRCNRQRIQSLGGHYDRACRDQAFNLTIPHAIRFKNDQPILSWRDGIQGDVQLEHAWAQDDFIIQRKDGFFAYQLAVVVDDVLQGVTEVVRGADLLAPTSHQIALYHAFKQPHPAYFHLPVAIQDDGRKLSKQNHSPALDRRNGSKLLCAALRFLQQDPPAYLEHESAETIIAWGIQHWQIKQVPAQQHYPAPSIAFAQSNNI